METELYIGTSGYSYADWVGPVYPAGTTPDRFLELYSAEFNFCELNFSYYAMPSSRNLSAMISRTPPSFVFAVKAHSSLTHKVTSEWEKDASRFREGIEPLVSQGKCGEILFQFPFSFHYTDANRSYLDRLLQEFRAYPATVEFRNEDWTARDSVIAGLADRSVCLAMTDLPNLKGLPRTVERPTADRGYVRFHGRNAVNWWTGTNATRYDYLYSKQELTDWSAKIKKLIGQIRRLYLAFNNHLNGQAVANARQLKLML